MEYKVRYSPQFEKSLYKLKKKSPQTYQQVRNKIGEIIDNPKHFKPLKRPKARTRRAHVGSFVIKYKIVGGVIKILSFDHHDKAY